jgi:uncharacterized protein YuzB (UPF0349 family)
MNEFRVCDICEAVDSESMIKRLKAMDPNASIEVGCQGFCGIGATKPFVIVNGIPAIADTEDEVIEKVKEILEK